MVANPTRELEQHLKELHLPTMRQCYGEQATVATHDSWTYEQYLHEVVALEVDARRQNRVRALSPRIPAPTGEELGRVQPQAPTPEDRRAAQHAARRGVHRPP